MSDLPLSDDDNWLIDDDPLDAIVEQTSAAPWRILVVDDEPDIHVVTRRALEKLVFKERPIEILSAYTGAEGYKVLASEPDIALVLLDVVMETPDAGLKLAHDIRNSLNNQVVRIVLRTGQPGNAPEEQVIVDFDINDYKSKTELTKSRLFVTVVSSLRAYEGLVAIEHHYQELRQREAEDLELRSAKELAETKAATKGQFLATMSHEIRTPMNAILGMLKLLHDTELSPRQLDYTDKTERAAKSLLGLLNDILDFSKMDAGKMILDPQPFAIDRLMRDLAIILSAYAGQKPLEVLFDIDPNLPKAFVGDAMRLQQVLINLSGNAIKFTAMGEVVVKITLEKMSGLYATLRFAVRDTGIGIDAESQAYIFTGFSQAEASTTRRFGGTGLGLSISKRLVELMGGTLELESASGKGSTFHFELTLPVADAAELSALPAPLPVRKEMDVLLADDNPLACRLTARMLQSLGWKVDAVSDGPQAVALVQARVAAGKAPYQAIFVDWEMPGIDGWATLDQIRKLMPAPNTPISIMVTALGRDMLSQRTIEEQANLQAFLVKPVTASMLSDAVAQALAGRSNVRTTPRAKSDKPKRLMGLHLLVVEDNLINQQVARELLQGAGAVVDVAENGELGVQAIAKASPMYDAVLMDIQMPVMDGYTATQAVRKDLGLDRLPIIAMTANAMPSDRAACLAAGMNEHVGKPFDLAHLIEVLLNHTKRATGGAFQATTPSTSAHVEPAASDLLPAVDALDVDSALGRMGGDTSLYLEVLQDYLRDLNGQPDQLDALLKAGDLVGALRLLHTIKGLSSTVGATYMAAVARDAERSVKLADVNFEHQALRGAFREAVSSTGVILGTVALRLRE